MKSTVAFFLMLISLSANAVVINIAPDFDGRIRDIFGSSFGPELLPADGVIESFSDGTFETRTIIEFNISAISGSIVSADILLPAATSVDGGTILDVFAYSGNGTLELADAFAGTQLATFNPTTSSPNTISLDTSVLQTILDGGATYFGFMMAVSAPGQQAFWTHPANSTISTLRIDATVPEPPILALMGLGLTLLGYSRKKLKPV